MKFIVVFLGNILFLLSLFIGNANAQAATYTIDGKLYEAVEWPVTTGILPISGANTSTGTWTLNGGGNITLSGNTNIEFLSSNDFTFGNAPYDANGYTITGVDRYRVNGGQTPDSLGHPLTQTYSLTSPHLPTQMLFYIGVHAGDIVVNGLKYAAWNFSTTDTSTIFTVLSNTPSFVLQNNGTSNLSWKTYGSDNNSAAILVSVANPNGISNFTIQTNRLDVNGNPRTYTNASQQSDYNPIAFLVPVPEPSVNLLLIFCGGLALFFRTKKVYPESLCVR
ncbi:MAG: hypothetical protein ACK5LK_10785 [Chthoniobacterales bacterium]